MINEFRSLRDDEIEILINAPSLVVALVAGADDNIDKNEIKGATQFVLNRAKNSDLLSSYYIKIAESFESKLKVLMGELPKLAHDQYPIIAVRLKQVNLILPKLRKEVAVNFHLFLLDLAQSVAESSGGVLGFKKVSEEEARVLKLGMIDDPNTLSGYQFY